MNNHEASDSPQACVKYALSDNTIRGDRTAPADMVHSIYCLDKRDHLYD